MICALACPVCDCRPIVIPAPLILVPALLSGYPVFVIAVFVMAVLVIPDLVFRGLVFRTLVIRTVIAVSYRAVLTIC